MKRKIWALNLVMLALLGVVGWRLREMHREGEERRRKVLEGGVRPAAPPVYPKSAAPGAVAAMTYADIAQRLLFSRDRNPNVVIEVAPKKPMPPLPRVHGLMTFGGDAAVIMSAGGQTQRAYRAGETIGEFKLIGVRQGKLALDWDGELVERSLEEVMPKTIPAPEPEPAAASSALPPNAPGTTTVLAADPAKAVPGASIGTEEKACIPGDASPAGTVVDGMRKVISRSPFGEACRWVPVAK